MEESLTKKFSKKIFSCIDEADANISKNTLITNEAIRSTSDINLPKLNDLKCNDRFNIGPFQNCNVN